MSPSPTQVALALLAAAVLVLSWRLQVWQTRVAARREARAVIRGRHIQQQLDKDRADRDYETQLWQVAELVARRLQENAAEPLAPPVDMAAARDAMLAETIRPSVHVVYRGEDS